MKSLPVIFSIFLFQLSFIYAQQGGNSVYGQGYNQTYGKEDLAGNLYLSDSTFIIEGNVLLNVIADEYVVTFGLEEESSTLKEANDRIEKRIQGFIADLTKMGIPGTNIYTDMTTQNKIYDFKVNENLAEQYLKGFELKKNVIVKLGNLKDLDELIIHASEHQIYDLVKVDYVVNDLKGIYTRLFKEATDIINFKKDLYAQATGMKLSTASQMYGERFYSYYPSQLYKSYTAYSSSEIYTDAETIKEVRKSPTYYYDKMDYSGFDRIINPAVTEPAVEFVLTLQIMFSSL